jgi:hypothetical protein
LQGTMHNMLTNSPWRTLQPGIGHVNTPSALQRRPAHVTATDMQQ